MTFLPLIDRELNVRARKRGSHWLRFGVALAAALFSLPQLLLSDWTASTNTVGRHVFNGLVIIAFILCSGAFFFTVDVISSERREGTLGLLFLTRVRWVDVVLGKLASNGIASLLALTALLPLLMIPVLTGGVTGGEAFRKGLALLNLLFLSLTVGLYASASQKERFSALRQAAIWMSLLLFITAGLDLIWYTLRYPPVMGLASPLLGVILAGDSSYKSFPGAFVTNLISVQLIAWAFLFRAGAHLRRLVQEDEPSLHPSAPLIASPSGSPTALATNSWTSQKARLSPAQWIASRQRGLRTILWLGAFVGFQYLFSYAFFFMGWGPFTRFGFVRSVATWLPHVLLSAASGAFFAWAASRFFIEGRKTGELELLLTTPLGAQSIVWGQWRALRMALRGPVAAMLVAMFLPFAFSMLRFRSMGSADADFIILSSSISFVISGLNIFFGVQALCLAGLWFGIRASGQFQAILWTIAVAKGCPYLLSLFGPLILGMLGLAYTDFRSAYHLLAFLPNLASLFFYLWLIHTAKRKVLNPSALAEPTLPPLPQAVRHLFLNLPETILKMRFWRAS